VKSLSVLVTARSSSVGASRPAAAQCGRDSPGPGAARPGCARRGDNCAGRCCAPTSLCCSPRGRAAKLASLASRAPLGQSPRVGSTKRAARADPEAALLGGADIAPPGAARPRGGRARRVPSALGCRRPRGQRLRCADRRRPRLLRPPQRYRQRRGSPAAGVPVRRREAQECRPAREARIVLLTRGDCPSGAREASVASFAAGPALRASQGTPAKRGQAPARRRLATRAFARADPCRVAASRPQAARAFASAVTTHRRTRNAHWSQ